MSRPYKIVQHKETEIGRFNIVQDIIEIQGKTYPYSYSKVDDCACILPIKGNKVVLIKQYRHALNQWCLEIPAGGVGTDEVETAARRELMEEIGYRAGKMELLVSLPVSQGTSTAKAHLFVAEDLEYVGKNTEPTEFIETYEVDIDKFQAMIKSKEFTHMVGIVAWYYYQISKESIL